MAFWCNGKKDYCDCTVLCADCEYFDNSGGMKTQTNADRIRKMSNEELSEMIADNIHTGACNDFDIPGKNPCPNNCRECVFEWLKKPVGVE